MGLSEHAAVGSAAAGGQRPARRPMHQNLCTGIVPPVLAVVLPWLPGCAVPAGNSAVVWPVAIPAGGAADPVRRQQASAALAALRAAPTDQQRIIWYGRRLAYLGLYREAVQVYGQGLRLHPGAPRLLRHRGHRYISLRRFDAAVADLQQAALSIAGCADEVEADGMPNARGIPRSTLHTNVWYHLGLAHYCRGAFESALYCYRRCLAAADNPDMEAATRYWLFLTATRLGRSEQAAAALAPVRADWDIIENHAYHQLLLLFRGDKTGAELRRPGDATADRTLEYGLARHLILTGDRKAGEAALRALAAAGSPAFGCIAAEADLRRGS